MGSDPAPELAIWRRWRRLVNTDPQRRCYDGCHFSSELVWAQWEVIESQRFLRPGADLEQRLKFWRELNEYAVSQRGENARCEYRIAPAHTRPEASE